MAEQQAAAGGDGGAGGVSLGKGAWDCDHGREIPPEKEAEVFGEVATMDHPFEGIPTIPPTRDAAHMAAFCNGCRYRVAAHPRVTVAELKQALWAGGIARASSKPAQEGGEPGMRSWKDLVLLYAMQVMQDEQRLSHYHVPPGCQVLVALEGGQLGALPGPDSPYWN